MPSSLRTLAALAALASVAHAATPVSVTFPPPPTNAVVDANFLGISIELSFLNVYCASPRRTLEPELPPNRMCSRQ
jgi:hypothetical protein